MSPGGPRHQSDTNCYHYQVHSGQVQRKISLQEETGIELRYYRSMLQVLSFKNLSYLYRGCSFAISICGLLYGIVVFIFRLSTFEINFKNSKSILSQFIDLCKLGVLVPCAWFLHQRSSLPYREVAMVATMIVELVIILDFYKDNISGRPFRSLDLAGEVFIVTGSNTGCGYETAVALADMGATVILACRSLNKANAARLAIIDRIQCPASKIIVLKLDLCSFDSVRAFVKEFIGLGIPLNCLINNAGVMMSDRSLTEDGLETVFTANHLSHFLLTNLLLPQLEQTNGRVVNVSSALHHSTSAFDCSDVMSERKYSLFHTYSQSKLANILFTLELHDRLRAKNSRVTCNSVHPGIVRTEVTRNMNPVIQFLNKLAAPILLTLQKTPAQGAYCSVFVATDPSIRRISGRYFVNSEVSEVSDAAKDETVRRELWRISEEITGIAKKTSIE